MLLNFSSWWEGLTSLETVFFLSGAIGSVVLLILVTATLFGGDMDGDLEGTDADISADGGIPFQFLSLKNATAFFTIFGWIGLYCLGEEMSGGMSIAIAVFAGLIAMTIMAALFYFLASMQENGTLDLRNSIGRHGEVYLPIPPRRDGFGKVQIQVQGSLHELDAFYDGDEKLKQGTVVKVLDVIDQHILLVEKAGH